jgi:hypothetical protein
MKPHKKLVDTWLPENYKYWDHVFLNKEYIFINIPKNASSTIRGALKTTNRVPLSKHKKSKAKKVIALRDPFNRVISSFNEISKCRSDGPKAETINSDWFKEKDKNLENSFIMFVDYISHRMYDAHSYKQSDFLYKKGLTLDNMDYVLLVETLNDDFKKIQDKDLKRANMSSLKAPNQKLKDLIEKDKELQNKIKSIYSEDFKLYKQAKEWQKRK